MKGKSLLALAALAVLASGCVHRDPKGVIQPSAAYKQAEALYLQERFTAARVRFQQVAANRLVNDRKWSLEARFYAARCAQLTGHFSEAVRTYNQLLYAPKYTRLDIRALAARADLSLETRDYKGAAQDYGRALKLFEKSAYIFPQGNNWGIRIDREKLLFGKGNAHWCMRDYRVSDRVFESYLASYPHPKGRFAKVAKERHTRFGPKHISTTFYVLVGGIFRIRHQAESLLSKVRAKGFGDATLQKRASASGTVYTVRVGAFDTRQEAHGLKRKLLAKGLGSFSLEVRP